MIKCAAVAQLAEQLICNQQVVGSSPVSSSTNTKLGVKCHWQVHRVVTPAVVGSNPAAPANLQRGRHEKW